MFLKNLNPERGLCNGTQFIMQQIGQYVLAVKILEGQNAFELISRLTLSILPGTLSCILTRKQFLIKMSFAITINKSQRHSLKKSSCRPPKSNIYSIAFSTYIKLSNIRPILWPRPYAIQHCRLSQHQLPIFINMSSIFVHSTSHWELPLPFHFWQDSLGSYTSSHSRNHA